MQRLFAILLAGAALPALAAGTATIQADTGGKASGVMEISWQSQDTVRLDPSGQPAYMLVRGDKAYSVSNAGGRQMVMDLSSLSQIASAPGGSFQQSPTIANAQSVTGMEATGQSQTVAGVEGEVYQITWTDARGATQTDDAVLSDDPLVAEMSAAFNAFADIMASAGGENKPNPVNQRLKAEGLGVLRFADKFRVTAISSDAPPAGHFELPAEPQDLGGALKGMRDAFQGK